MIIFIDLLSGKDVGSDSYEEVKKYDGAVIGLISKKIQLKEGDVDIGGNPSAEGGGEDEGVEASEVKSVINIVHSHGLIKIDLDSKGAKAAIKNYWKKLLEHFVQKKYSILGIEKPSKDKEKLKAQVSEAEKKLKKEKKDELKSVNAKAKNFKDNVKKLEGFLKDEILGNFSEFEFYMPDGAELGECIIVPARYEGEAVAPVFYYFFDGINQKKE